MFCAWLNLPSANPIQNAASAIAYTLPYIDICLKSTRYPIVGIMEESTIPIANPRIVLGIIRCQIFQLNGIWNYHSIIICSRLTIQSATYMYLQSLSLNLYEF